MKDFNGKSQPELKPSLDETLGKAQSEIEETENKANNAAEEFIEEEKLNNLDDLRQDDGDKIINNAAEELDGHKQGDKGLRHEEMDLEIINRAGNGKDGLGLNEEIAGDHGKEAGGYPEDLHMIEGQQEENDDLGDGKFVEEKKSVSNIISKFIGS